MHTDTIKQLILAQIPDATVEIEGADGKHFSARVVSAQFNGKSRVERQQMVYAALKDLINDGSLHAISIKTLTPTE